jgi:hypothetical protein
MELVCVTYSPLKLNVTPEIKPLNEQFFYQGYVLEYPENQEFQSDFNAIYHLWKKGFMSVNTRNSYLRELLYKITDSLKTRYPILQNSGRPSK